MLFVKEDEIGRDRLREERRNRRIYVLGECFVLV